MRPERDASLAATLDFETVKGATAHAGDRIAIILVDAAGREFDITLPEAETPRVVEAASRASGLIREARRQRGEPERLLAFELADLGIRITRDKALLAAVLPDGGEIQFAADRPRMRVLLETVLRALTLAELGPPSDERH